MVCDIWWFKTKFYITKMLKSSYKGKSETGSPQNIEVKVNKVFYEYGLLDLYPTMSQKPNCRRWFDSHSLQPYLPFKLYGTMEPLKPSKRSCLSKLSNWANWIFHWWNWWWKWVDCWSQCIHTKWNNNSIDHLFNWSCMPQKIVFVIFIFVENQWSICCIFCANWL